MNLDNLKKDPVGTLKNAVDFKKIKKTHIAAAVAGVLVVGSVIGSSVKTSAVEDALKKELANSPISEIARFESADASIFNSDITIHNIEVGIPSSNGRNSIKSDVLLIDAVSMTGAQDVAELESFEDLLDSSKTLKIENLRLSPELKTATSEFLSKAANGGRYEVYDYVLNNESATTVFLYDTIINSIGFEEESVALLKLLVESPVTLNIGVELGDVEGKLDWDESVEGYKSDKRDELRATYIPAKIDVEVEVDGAIKAVLNTDATIDMYELQKMKKRLGDKFNEPMGIATALMKAGMMYGQELTFRVEDAGIKDAIEGDENHPLKGQLDNVRKLADEGTKALVQEIETNKKRLEEEPDSEYYQNKLKENEGSLEFAEVATEVLTELNGFEISVEMGDEDTCFPESGKKTFCSLMPKDIGNAMQMSLREDPDYEDVEIEIKAL